ncbi:phage/plasmid primase, P4 family [Shouchella lonarensis]|uniref:Putative DNA primase/helicase n=1 Tax=Shouchella lonarensis TaxID=1464122 RepID=A0A1G6ILE8_9BACI|nr:phage/plasmid primase, P4 family [Shouchella lonarensis]SDC07307.1 putative DNA primase/helicase [Shouchella lonarensis]
MYNFTSIPDELKQCPQWVLWRKVIPKNEDKPRKVPFQVNGAHAKPNDPETWTMFTDVVQAYKNGSFDGIGFVFTESDPYVGIDIDHCIEGDVFSPLAHDIVYKLNSYTERSPSGTGLHIIIKSDLVMGKRNTKQGVEVYSHGRYFTFTGNVVNAVDVEERTDEIKAVLDAYIPDKQSKYPQFVQSNSHNPQPNALYANLNDQELLNKMFSSARGAAIKQLFDGHLINDDHSASDMALCNHLAFWLDRDAAHMDAIFRQSSLMRDKWDEQRGDNTYGALCIQKAICECNKTISEYKQERQQERAQTAQTTKQGYAGTAPDAQNQPQFNFTELGNAMRIKHHQGHRIRYCEELEWMIWNGKKWRRDRAGKMRVIASDVLGKLHEEADKVQDEKEKIKAKKWAMSCESRKVIDASIDLLSSYVPVEKREFDQHEMLLNCSNGVVDLTTGEVKPHDKNLYLTQMTDVEYDPDAICPTWLNFLKTIIVDKSGKTDTETLGYLQKAFGYALTGSTKEQCMFFFHGGGKNGKSTLVSTLQEVLGDYGKQADSKTFVKKKHEGVSTDIAMLDGSRFVAVSESEEGQQLDESLVKQLTGSDSVTARFLFKDNFTFKPSFKIFFSTNHKPIVKNDDEGIWRRVHLIPFNAYIPPKNRDFDLPQKLKAELSGILAWMVRGALKWQKEGLEKPEMVEQSTRVYREEMDILAPFIDELCIKHTEAKIEAKALHGHYKDWCFKNDETLKATSSQKFYRMLEMRGFKKERGNYNKMYFYGIGLKKDYIQLVRDQKSNTKKEKSNTKSNTDRTFIEVKLDGL